MKPANVEFLKPAPFARVLLGNRCPACGEGPVFRGVYRMHRKCSHCGLVYEKEPGYFLGAVVGVYFLSVFLLFPTFVYLQWVVQMDVPKVVMISVLQLLVMHPILFRIGKLLWLYVETKSVRGLDRTLK